MAIDHLMLKVKDWPKAKDYYTAAFKPLGLELLVDGGTWGGFGRPNEKSGRVYVRQEENPGRLHFALLAPSAEAVKQYWQAATAAGGKDNGAPGPRSHVGSDGKGVGCFVIDLDDNNIEVLYHGE